MSLSQFELYQEVSLSLSLSSSLYLLSCFDMVVLLWRILVQLSVSSCGVAFTAMVTGYYLSLNLNTMAFHYSTMTEQITTEGAFVKRAFISKLSNE